MDWTAGYTSDVEYTAGFYSEQSPAVQNFACLLNGIEPVDIRKPFTYFELGFGRGLTANILASTHANARFYAADFNPSHVAGASQLASEAKLTNLTLLESSFEELGEGCVAGLPQFDFISLHGIYTWVTAENRRHIVNFISRYLKPGGLVYMSYNAMPGWAAALPLQRLIVEHADLHPNRSDAQVKSAGTFIEQLSAAKAGYFSVNPALQQRMEALRTGNPNYLVHEYMHKHWQPMYFADVARDMAEAKLDYVGSAESSGNFNGLFMPKEAMDLIGSTPNQIFAETVKDYFLNTSFRKDVFVRGARRMAPVKQAEWLSMTGIVLTVPREQATLALKLPQGQVNAKPELYNPVLHALESGPKTLAQLGMLPELASSNMLGLAQIAAMLACSGQAAVFFANSDKASVATALQMNRALANRARFGDEFQAFASPLLGSGVGANFIERLVYNGLVQKIGKDDTVALAKYAWQSLAAQGRTMIKNGHGLQTVEENLAELRERIIAITRDRLPVWRHLGAL